MDDYCTECGLKAIGRCTACASPACRSHGVMTQGQLPVDAQIRREQLPHPRARTAFDRGWHQQGGFACVTCRAQDAETELAKWSPPQPLPEHIDSFDSLMEIVLSDQWVWEDYQGLVLSRRRALPSEMSSYLVRKGLPRARVSIWPKGPAIPRGWRPGWPLGYLADLPTNRKCPSGELPNVSCLTASGRLYGGGGRLLRRGVRLEARVPANT